MFWATVGGLGLTGMILRARIRLRPVETAWMWCQDTVLDDLDGVIAGLHAAHDAVTSPPHGWTVMTAAGRSRNRQRLLAGAIADLPRRMRYGRRLSASTFEPVPPLPRPGVIHGPAVGRSTRYTWPELAAVGRRGYA